MAEKMKKGPSEAGRKTLKCPHKQGINLNMREQKGNPRLTLLVGCLAIVILAGCVAKFGVIDQYRRLDAAQAAYASVHTEYTQMQELLKGYDRLLMEYRTYSMEWATDGSEDNGKLTPKMEIINKRLQEKYKALEENEVRYEEIGCDDADYVIVAFGSSARICSATVEMARAEGLKVGLLRPITLYPFPKKPLAELAARGVKGFLSAELNAGQMVEDVRLAVNGVAPVEHFGRQGGMMFAPDEVLAALKEKLIKK